MNTEYRILVAIDLKTGTDRLLAEAQRYSRAFNAKIDIIHVADPDPEFIGYIKSSNPDAQDMVDSPRISRANALRIEHQRTQALGETLRANGVRLDQALTVQGPILTTILDHARKLNSDLLILGSHHHGALYRLWYGDTVAEATVQAPCALLVIPVA
jgi:nucleotide-binding universal stress UspA family protein